MLTHVEYYLMWQSYLNIYQNIRALPWRSGAAKDWRHPNKTNPIATNFILSETFLSLFCFLGTETVLDLI
jgi:hypothetical protein